MLRPDGTLIFKWNEHEVPVAQVLALTPMRPLVGNRCGKTAKSHWIVFMKPNVKLTGAGTASALDAGLAVRSEDK